MLGFPCDPLRTPLLLTLAQEKMLENGLLIKQLSILSLTMLLGWQNKLLDHSIPLSYFLNCHFGK